MGNIITRTIFDSVQIHINKGVDERYHVLSYGGVTNTTSRRRRPTNESKIVVVIEWLL